MGSQDIANLVYVGKVSIAKVSARSALKLGVAIEGVFLDYRFCHAVNAAVVTSKWKEHNRGVDNF